jgi:hypothetical protein
MQLKGIFLTFLVSSFLFLSLPQLFDLQSLYLQISLPRVVQYSYIIPERQEKWKDSHQLKTNSTVLTIKRRAHMA